MNKIVLISSVIMQLVLVSCATVSKDSCSQKNWEEVGEANAKNGKTDLSVNYFAKKCKSLGVPPNIESFNKGVKKGLISYCSNEKAYEFGVRNLIYDLQLCPNDNYKALSTEYYRGLIEFRAEIRGDIKNNLLRNNNEIKETLREIERMIGPEKLIVREKIESIRDLIKEQERYVNNKL